MKLYARILSYLGPYRGLLLASILATFGFAAFDALTIVALIPLLNALFGSAPITMQDGGDVGFADFDVAPIWGFDTRLESVAEADETWVRPQKLERVPGDSDVLFAAATLTPGELRQSRGAVCFRFERSELVITGCALLSPRYAFISSSRRYPRKSGSAFRLSGMHVRRPTRAL